MHSVFCSSGEGTTEWKRQRNKDLMCVCCVCVTQCVFKKLKCILRLAISWIKSAHAQIKPIAGCNNLVDRCEFCGKSTNFCAFQFHYFFLSFYWINVVVSLFYTPFRLLCFCENESETDSMGEWIEIYGESVFIVCKMRWHKSSPALPLLRLLLLLLCWHCERHLCDGSENEFMCRVSAPHRHHNDVFDGKELFRHFIHQVKLTNSIEQCTHFSSLSLSLSICLFLSCYFVCSLLEFHLLDVPISEKSNTKWKVPQKYSIHSNKQVSDEPSNGKSFAQCLNECGELMQWVVLYTYIYIPRCSSQNKYF